MGEHLVAAVADGFSEQIHALGGTPRTKRLPRGRSTTTGARR